MDKNLQKYQAFVTTVDLGSFTKAAARLSYTQSSISKMIADLERECGMDLLKRDRGGISLTAQGMDLLPYARQLVESFRIMEEHVQDLTGIQHGTIRIGTFSSVATHWLPNVIRRFRKEYPGVDYELLLGDYQEIERWVASGRVDCGFLRLPAENPDLATMSLKEDPLRVILPEGHALAADPAVDIRRLEGQPFMMLEHGKCSEVAELFAKHRVRPDVRFITWDDYAIMSMVEGGLGIAILPELILKRIPYHLEIRPLNVPASRTIAIAMPGQRRVPPALEKLLDYLKYRDFREDPGSEDPESEESGPAESEDVI